MEIKEIVKELEYYNEELPKEALEKAIEYKEEMIPELLKMLEYTKENLENIFNEKDEFYGYIYAFFLLAEFREKRAFPYLIDLINKGEEYVEYIIGDDYPDYLHRLLASCYNGDDKLLFDIIEDNKCNEFIRSSVLQTFAILYLNNIKSRDFIVKYFKKLLNEKEENDNSDLYEEILREVTDLKLKELKNDIESLYYLIENEEEKQELKERLEDDCEINKSIYPIKHFYEYMYNTIEIMEEWECFCYKEDEEFEESDDYKICDYIIFKREENWIEKKINIGRNDLCYCGSGKKYKKCCINKKSDLLRKQLNSIDEHVCKATWLYNMGKSKKASRLYRIAWFDVQEICKAYNIKSIDEYDDTYKGYDCLLNWIQDYDSILEMSNEEEKLYERIELWNKIEGIFDINNEKNVYWKESSVRAKANAEFRLGNEEKATKIIEDYLKIKPEWTWGYIEMADWYNFKRDKKHYNLEKAKEILLRAENIKGIEEVDAVLERLWDIYKELNDKDNVKIYATKMNMEE